jgi:4-hydroxybenzoate polyprenyltransferase
MQLGAFIYETWPQLIIAALLFCRLIYMLVKDGKSNKSSGFMAADMVVSFLAIGFMVFVYWRGGWWIPLGWAP